VASDSIEGIRSVHEQYMCPFCPSNQPGGVSNLYFWKRNVSKTLNVNSYSYSSINLIYLIFSCSSNIGRVGGQQYVNMQGWCLPDIHETLHAMGFDHEENRRDRDYYLAFNWSNIKPSNYFLKLEEKLYV